jgi:hypothetical protein
VRAARPLTVLRAVNAAGGDHAVAALQGFDQFRLLIKLLLLRADDKDVKHPDNKQKRHKTHPDRSRRTAGRIGRCRCRLRQRGANEKMSDIEHEISRKNSNPEDYSRVRGGCKD